MQLVLEGAFIDKPLNFDIGFDTIQFFMLVCSLNACKDAFNPNVSISQSNCTEVLHFCFSVYSTSSIRIMSI